MEGSIVKIHLENFVTFHELTVFPKSHLNLITGPNGTGKSSLMCAMCLGLAGKPRIVGRASSVSEYIRYNAEKAKIDIELMNPKGVNYTVSRTIFRDNKSTWTIGGFSCTQKEVESLACKLNIQIDNLCQFLPQDRVQDFAKMNSQTLMENTEKSVGGLEMWENHMSLKQLGSVYLENEKKLATKREHLAHEEQIFASLQAAVDKMASKRALIDRVEKLSQKLAYMAYLKHKLDLEMSEKLFKKKVTLRKALEKEHKPLEVTVEKEKRKIKIVEDKYKDLGTLYTKHNSSCEEHFEFPDTINDKIKDNVNEFERWCLNEKKKLEKLKDIRVHIEYLKNTIQQSPDSEEILAEKEAKTLAEEKEEMKRIYYLQKTKQTLEINIVNIEHQIKLNDNELAKANDVGVLKLKKLKSKGLYEPIMWFRDNKHKLRGKAYEPMAMVINMKSDKMAKYLENIIPHRDIIAFVCENAEDSNFLMEELRDKMKYKVNIITSKPTLPMSSFTRPYEIEDLRKFGFYSFVSDTFTAPETVMRYLFNSYNIHRIPIGDETTYSKANEVPKEIRTFMTENKKFTTRMSRYSSECISSSMDLKPSVFLTASVNEANVKECMSRTVKLKEELKGVQNEVTSIELQEKQHDENIQSSRKIRSEIKGTLTKINSFKTRLASLKKNESEILGKKSNEEEQRKKLEQSNQECALKLISGLMQNVSHLKKFGDIIMSMKLTQKEVQKARHDVSFLEQELRTSNKKLKEAEKDELNFKDILEEAQRETVRHLKQLEELTKMKYNCPSFKELLKEFDEFPNTGEEIRGEIHITQTKADCLGHSDKNAIVEYERRKTTVTAIKNVVEKLTSELNEAKKRIEEVKSKWLPFVNDLVKNINSTFGDLLAKINYVGEVVLVQGQNEDDFSNYGFKIQVKFRQEGGLQELNQFRQSGGERAVAIAIYLMSLQELTSVPFRCVDEINQGMDEFHEAVVFKLLSDIVSERKTAQYFLFTPKVLHSLQFSRTLLYVCVNNGELENTVINCKTIHKNKKTLTSKTSRR